MRLPSFPRSASRRPSGGRTEADASLQRERRRLQRAFTALLVALAPATAAAACSHPPATHATGTGGAGVDAGDHGGSAGSMEDAGPDAVADADAAANEDAPPDAPADAGLDVDCSLLLFAPADAGADAPPACFVTLQCGLNPQLGVIDCDVYDEAGPLDCTIVAGMAGCDDGGPPLSPPGAVQLYCPGCLGCAGRRPAGLVRPRRLDRPGPSALGAYFARAAHDEAASVHAFQRMREELSLHRAPAPLVRAAARAERDERRHARAMADRARAAGARVVAPVVRRRALRGLEAIARENAVEGCVLETFGALLAGWHAAHARDASLRRTFARIAEDETRHAALAWAVARWAEERLPPAARARVAAARARTVHALRDAARACPPDPHDPADAMIGRPSPAQRAQLFEGMTRRLGLAGVSRSPEA